MKTKKPHRWDNVKLTPYEQSIEDAVDLSIPPTPTDPALLTEVKAAMKRAAEARAHGGARPGSGRKPKDTIPTTINLTPESKAILKKLAKKQPGGMSGAINRLILGAK